LPTLGQPRTAQATSKDPPNMGTSPKPYKIDIKTLSAFINLRVTLLSWVHSNRQSAYMSRNNNSMLVGRERSMTNLRYS